MKHQTTSGASKIRIFPVALFTFLVFGYSFAADELVAQWSFDEYGVEEHFYYDITGNGYDAAFSKVSVAEGVHGKAVECSDTEVKIEVVSSTGNFNFEKFTVEALIYFNESPVNPGSFDNFQKIFDNSRTGLESSGFTGGYGLMVSDRGCLLFSMSSPEGGSWINCVSTTVLSEKTWYHVAASYDGFAMKIYINGQPAGQTESTGGYLLQSDMPATIGCQMQITDQETMATRQRNNFKGLIDEVKLYDYALSDETIRENFTAYDLPQVQKPEPQLLAHWSFDDDNADEKLYHDVTGNGYDATCSKSLGLVEGLSNKALNSSETDYTFHPANSQDNLSPSEFSVETLVKLAKVGGSFQTVFSTQSYPAPSDGGYGLEINDQGRLRFSMVATGGSDWLLCEGTSILKQDTWYHLAITFDGSTLKSYVNGVLENSVARGSGYKAAAQTASIGCQENSSGSTRNWLSGYIDELKVYNYALSAASIEETVKEYGLPEPEPEPKLLAHWSFDEIDTETNLYKDVTGNGYDGQNSRISVGEGVLGDALDCRGATSEIIVPSSAGQFTLNKYTIEGWVYSNIDLNNPGSFYNYKGIFDNARVGMEMSGETGGYNLQISDLGHIHAGMSVPGGGSWYKCEGTTLLQPRQWYHVACTYDNATLRVYLNGVLEKETQITGGYLPSALPARIASQYQLTDYVNNTGRYRHQFDGKIDELKLYNYPLDAATLLEHYNALKPAEEAPFEINLGMKTTFAQPGDTVVLPVYIANHEAFSISAVQLALDYSADKLELLSMTKDSGLVARWELFDWNSASAGNVKLGMAGTQLDLNYGEGELFRMVFVVTGKAADNDTCVITLGDVNIDEKNNLIVSTTQNGRIIIEKKSVLYGDVTGNEEVNVVDAQMVLKYVVGGIGLPDDCCPNFTVAVADVSGNGTITSYDAALIFQYSLGLIPAFPIETATASPKKLAKRAGVSGEKALLDIKLVSSNAQEQVFDLIGSKLFGFYAGEFAISCESGSKLLSKSVITTDVKGATLTSRFLPADNLLKVAISSNDDIDDDEPVTIVRITLPPAGDNSSPEFSVRTALINEGRIPTDYENSGLTAIGISPGVNRASVPVVAYLKNNRLIVHNSQAGLAVVTLSDLHGRVVAKYPVTGLQTGAYDMSRLGKGIYLFRIRSGGYRTSGRITQIGR